jgi:tetratricopeptide (TPR) repeat protein
MQVARLLLALVLATSQLAMAADPPAPAPKVDQTTVLRAAAFFNAGRLVEAEPLYRAILAAVDAGSLAQEELGHCLGPLVQIYRTWGRNEDALRMAERYRKFLQTATKLDAKVRQQQLDDNTLQLVDILSGLARYDDAERYLTEAIHANQTADAAGSMWRLLLLVKSAQLADDRSDSAKTRERWSQVVGEGKASLARIDKHEWPAKYFADCTSTLAAAYVALEDFSSAIAIRQRLLDLQIAQRDHSGEISTRAEIAGLHVQNHEFVAARGDLTAAIAVAQKPTAVARRGRSSRAVGECAAGRGILVRREAILGSGGGHLHRSARKGRASREQRFHHDGPFEPARRCISANGAVSRRHPDRPAAVEHAEGTAWRRASADDHGRG